MKGKILQKITGWSAVVILTMLIGCYFFIRQNFSKSGTIIETASPKELTAPKSIMPQPLKEKARINQEAIALNAEKEEERAEVNAKIEETSEVKQKKDQKIILAVPFTSQSPFANWDDLHNEACEEAGLIMAKFWLLKQELSPEVAEKEILASVDWQNKNWGGHYDLPADKIVELGKSYFGLPEIYFTEVSAIDDIKNETDKGNLVIIPTAGRVLKNPYYRQPGPVYHILVVRGYDGEEIITNDPGTRKGKEYNYSENIVIGAIHNWPINIEEEKRFSKEEMAEEILKGKKIMIVIKKQVE